jgi:hypothetical protein
MEKLENKKNLKTNTRNNKGKSPTGKKGKVVLPRAV